MRALAERDYFTSMDLIGDLPDLWLLLRQTKPKAVLADPKDIAKVRAAFKVIKEFEKSLQPLINLVVDSD